jgi:hypothetical protein
VPVTIISAIQLIVMYRSNLSGSLAKSSVDSSAEGSDVKVNRSRYFTVLGSILLLLALISLIGYVYGIAVFVFINMKFLEKQSWLASILYTLFLTVSVYLIFKFALKIYLYNGILFY